MIRLENLSTSDLQIIGQRRKMSKHNISKEIVLKNDMFAILDMLDTLGMRYWVDGGWGVDLLSGQQNRDHRDLDIDFDDAYFDQLLTLLRHNGYSITTDWRPVRIELYHDRLGFLDIHPLTMAADGSTRQSDGKGGWYDFQFDWFTNVNFEDRIIACISLDGQLHFHSGYEPREKDLIDLQILNMLKSQNIMERYQDLISQYMEFFCNKLHSRCVGTVGNRDATDFFKRKLTDFGWLTEETSFTALDWNNEGATLVCNTQSFKVKTSPYSLGCSIHGQLVEADSIIKLEQNDLSGKIVLLHGELAQEPLMPKNFVFYNPDEHKRIIAALEKSGVSAIITATARHSALAGGVYPFPIIEDGDFDIPSVFMTEEEGNRLLTCCGQSVQLDSVATRIPSSGCNVTGRKGNNPGNRIVVTAHIDAKRGTPGAIDNATGIIILLLLAEHLKDLSFDGKTIELLAINGEDYYAVPGQMAFLNENKNQFDNITVNINIDCAGYYNGKTAVSLFDLPARLHKIALNLINDNDELVEGVPWYQGDHSLFLQNGIAAIVFTSQWFLDNIETQNVTHTLKDTPSVVRWQTLVAIVETISKFLHAI